MGLDSNGIRFALYCKAHGVDFSRVAMIGRQGLHLYPRDLKGNFREFGYLLDDNATTLMLTKNGGYAEEFFRYLGAEIIHSFDKSDYEGASHVHDMNQILPDAFKEQYSVVIDGGSLEHVFNIPVAMRNCMNMVRAGGYYIGISPSNNCMGHGFYQFSPELFFSLFCVENGYEVVNMVVCKDKPRAGWYSVKNPASIGRRVTLANCSPTYLFVLARRTKCVEPLKSMPQQSDYVSLWESANGDVSVQKTKRRPWSARVAARIPQSIRYVLKRLLSSFRPEFDPRCFQPMTKRDIGLM